MSEENTNENNPESSNANSDNTSQTSASNQTTSDFKPWGMEEKTFCMLMHLSQFLTYIIPLAGLVMPVIMWTSNKSESKFVDEHGKAIVNAMISYFIWTILSCGIFVLLWWIFTVIAALKANNGELYKYPLAISFIK